MSSQARPATQHPQLTTAPAIPCRTMRSDDDGGRSAPLEAPGRNGRADGIAMPPTSSPPQGKKIRRMEGLLLECGECKRMRPRGWFTRKGRWWSSLCRECRKPVKAAAAATRRTRLMGRGTYRAADVHAAMKRQGGRCAICGGMMLEGYHVDHRVPLARGGMNTADNIQLTHGICNLRKGAKL
jgi:hypothetical protein